MSTNAIVIQAVVRDDGTLELAEKIPLPPGRVQVAILPLADLSKDPFWQRMEAIWAGQKARGHVPRSVEEVEREREAFRNEWEERQQGLELLHQEAEKRRGPTKAPEEAGE